jgi:hypothetical protein
MQRIVKIGQMVRNLEEECPTGTIFFRQLADFPSRGYLSQRPQHISFCFWLCSRTNFIFFDAQLLVRLIFQDVTQQTMSPL